MHRTCYRKEKEAALQPTVGKLKRMVAIQVMDLFQAKRQILFLTALNLPDCLKYARSYF